MIQVVTTFAMICLSVWDIPKGLKFASFYLGGVTGMASPILVSVLSLNAPLGAMINRLTRSTRGSTRRSARPQPNAD